MKFSKARRLSGELTIPGDKSISHRSIMFGSIAALDLVWNIADLFMAIMAITNLIAIVLLGKIALKALQDYNRQRRISKKNIIFKSSSISELKDSTSEWE